MIEDEGGANQTTTYTDFDALGNPGLVTCPGCCGGNATRYTYDLLGRVLTEENALGIVTKYKYDAAGRLSRMIEDYTDDAEGRNVVTDYTYDAAGRLLAARTTAGGETRRTYDRNGRLAAFIDANGHTTTYTYDAADRLEQITEYRYDAAGNLEQQQDAKGQITSYTYNDANQLTYSATFNGRCVMILAARVRTSS